MDPSSNFTRDLIRNSIRNSSRIFKSDFFKICKNDNSRDSCRNSFRDFIRNSTRDATRNFSKDFFQNSTRDSSTNSSSSKDFFFKQKFLHEFHLGIFQDFQQRQGFIQEFHYLGISFKNFPIKAFKDSSSETCRNFSRDSSEIPPSFQAFHPKFYQGC